MSSALKRGRTLNPKAVAVANNQHKQRLNELLRKDRLSLTPKERAEARRLSKRWDFWNALP